MGVKRWQIRPKQLATIIASNGLLYDCSSLILANTLLMIVCLTVTNSSMKRVNYSCHLDFLCSN